MDFRITIWMTYVLATIILLIFITTQIKIMWKLPPGPWGIPVFGCLLWTKNNLAGSAKWYLELTKKYGEVVSVSLGSNTVICLGSAKLVRQYFSRLDSLGRPHTPLNDILGGKGIFTAEGDLWSEQILFLKKKFRAMGIHLTNCHFERYILIEVEDFLQNLEPLQDQPVNPLTYFGRHIHNVICQLLMSFRFETDDDEFKSFHERVSEGMQLYGKVHIGEHLPWMVYFPGKRRALELIRRNLAEISEFHASKVRERITETEERDHIDLLDLYLFRIRLESNNESLKTIFPGVNPEEQLVQVMNDLFSAGMEAPRTALVWSLVMMLREPEVAAKVREVLAVVVGHGNLVTLAHRRLLVYIEAVLFETYRRVSVVPLGTTHVNLTPWTIKNFEVPAGSHIIPLINKIHMDPESFPEPEVFKPERFIKDGELYYDQSFMAFGLGRRMCLGDQLARMELFLFFANLMNHFTFEICEGEKVPELDGVYGLTHSPTPFTLKFRKIEV